MIVEYITPDPRIREDLMKIKDVGRDDEISIALAHRGKALRTFKSKWSPYVSNNFIRRIEEAIILTKADQSQRPQLPNINAYNFDNTEEIQEFYQEVVKAWNNLRQFYEHNLHKRPADKNQRPIDKFVQVTAVIDSLLLSVDIKDYKVIEFNDVEYTFMSRKQAPKRLVCIIDDDDVKGKEHFKGLVERMRKPIANLNRWAIYENFDELNKSSIKRVDLREKDKSIMSMVESEKEEAKKLKEDEIHYSKTKVVKATTILGKKVPAPDQETGSYSKSFLNDMRKEYLNVIGASLGVEDSTKMKRKELVEAIYEKQFKKEVAA